MTDTSKVKCSGIGNIFVNPSVTLDPNTAYYLMMDPGVFIDIWGVPSPGTLSTNIYTFTTGSAVDTAPPVVTGLHDNFSQTEDFTAQSRLYIVFNELVHGFGTVELRRSSDGSLFKSEQFNTAYTTELVINNDDLPMAGNTGYYITLGPGSYLRDAAGNDFGGIAPGALSFTTVADHFDPQTIVITIQQPHVVVPAGVTKTLTNGAPIYELGGYSNDSLYERQFVLENLGRLIVNGPQDAQGVSEFYQGTGAGVFENRGEFTVTAGWTGIGSNASLTANWGTMTITSGSAGRRSPGIYNKAMGVTGAFANWGRLTVSCFDIPNAIDTNDYAGSTPKIVNEAGATIEAIYLGTEIGGGIGINLKHDGEVYNAGTIRATGTTYACGVKVGEATGRSINNTGSIIAETTGTTDPRFPNWPIESYGIDLTGVLVPIRYQVLNSGTITAKTAIIARHSNYVIIGPKLDIENTGQINGDIILEGSDDLIVNSGTISGKIALAAGNDTYDGRLGYLVGSVDGGVGDDTLLGGSGNDTLTDNDGTNTLDGGSGTDTADFTLGYGFGAIIDLALGTARGALGIEAVNTLISIENVITDFGNDVIDGSDVDNVLTSNAGNDTLFGRVGDDALIAGRGNDTLNGGADNDVLDGGAGIDRVTYAGSRGAYAVTRNSDGTTTVSGPEGSDTVLMVERLEFADQTLVIGTAAGFDFAGDGSSDILFQNTNGQLQMWFQNGLATTRSSTVSANPGASVRAKTAGDFDGDSQADILFQDAGGQVTLWLMDHSSVAGQLVVNAVAGTVWRIVGTGDFNGDLKSDIVLQHDNGEVAVWLMNGANLVGGDAIHASAAGGWQVKAPGDFDGDGNSDILFQHTNGQVAVWLMDGLAVFGADAIHADAGTTWKVKATADLNGDGKSDILFQNSVTSQIAVWLMNGIDLVGGDAINASAAGGWQLVGSGDLDGNGSSDILLQNTNGQIAGWMMSGLDLLGADTIGPNLGAAWKLIAPTG